MGGLETGCSILSRARRGPEGVLIFRWAPPRVDDLVQAMGLFGISKSQVSKLCKDIDERVNAFLDRPIKAEWPYLWLDAYLPQGPRRWPDCLGGGDNCRTTLATWLLTELDAD